MGQNSQYKDRNTLLTKLVPLLAIMVVLAGFTGIGMATSSSDDIANLKVWTPHDKIDTNSDSVSMSFRVANVSENRAETLGIMVKKPSGWSISSLGMFKGSCEADTGVCFVHGGLNSFRYVGGTVTFDLPDDQSGEYDVSFVVSTNKQSVSHTVTVDVPL